MSCSYFIAKVYDYKGGELSTYTNLTFKRFITELAEYYEDIEGLEEITSNTTYDEVLQVITDYEVPFGDYAGGDTIVASFYKVENSKMTQVDIDDYLPDIAKHILENWK
jgi:hypothetical protein